MNLDWLILSCFLEAWYFWKLYNAYKLRKYLKEHGFWEMVKEDYERTKR